MLSFGHCLPLAVFFSRRWSSMSPAVCIRVCWYCHQSGVTDVVVWSPLCLDPSDGVLGRFDLAALSGCHTLNVVWFVLSHVICSSRQCVADPCRLRRPTVAHVCTPKGVHGVEMCVSKCLGLRGDLQCWQHTLACRRWCVCNAVLGCGVLDNFGVLIWILLPQVLYPTSLPSRRSNCCMSSFSTCTEGNMEHLGFVRVVELCDISLG